MNTIPCGRCGAQNEIVNQCRHDPQNLPTTHAHAVPNPAPVQLDPSKWRTEWRTNMHGECYPVLLIEGPDDIHRRFDFAEDEMPLLNLIRSAPDLLEACERVLRAIEWSTTDDRMTPEEQAETLRAAIAKATSDD